MKHKMSQIHRDLVMHHLKTWPEYFEAVRRREKTFEIRNNDRDFQKGDLLHLKEWNPHTKRFTGQEETREVTYVLYGGKFGLQVGYVALGLK